MSTSDHKRWSEDLAAYMLGALEPEEAAELERHLEGCERCREEMRWLEPAVHTLPESVERQEPPKQLRQSLMAEVRADARAERSSPRPSRWRGLWAKRGLRVATGFALVALVTAAAVGYEVGKDGSSEGESSTIVSRQEGGITVKMVRKGTAASCTCPASTSYRPTRSWRRGWNAKAGGSGAGAVRPRPPRPGGDDDRGHDRSRDGDGHQGAERRQRGADRRADRDDERAAVSGEFYPL